MDVGFCSLSDGCVVMVLSDGLLLSSVLDIGVSLSFDSSSVDLSGVLFSSFLSLVLLSGFCSLFISMFPAMSNCCAFLHEVKHSKAVNMILSITIDYYFIWLLLLS